MYHFALWIKKNTYFITDWGNGCHIHICISCSTSGLLSKNIISTGDCKLFRNGILYLMQVIREKKQMIYSLNKNDNNNNKDVISLWNAPYRPYSSEWWQSYHDLFGLEISFPTFRPKGEECIVCNVPHMMTSLNGNIFRVTGLLGGEGQWRGALMFSLIWAPINGWVNNGEAGDLRRHRAHYDVIVMNRPILYQVNVFLYERVRDAITCHRAHKGNDTTRISNCLISKTVDPERLAWKQ